MTIAVRLIVGVMKLPDGKLRKRFSENITEIPLVQIIDESPTELDPRFDVSYDPSLESLDHRFPLGTHAISLDKETYGSLLKVDGYEKSTVLVKVETSPPQPQFLSSFLAKNAYLTFLLS
jgi:hypothetical protein